MLLVCLSGTIATAASNKLPDLTPVVVDASQGSTATHSAARLRNQVPVARGKEGLLRLRVLMDGKPVKAAIKVARSDSGKVILQTESVHGQNGRHMQQTPFEVSLPAGKYNLYVSIEPDTVLESPLKAYIQTKALPIVIKNSERLGKTLTIPIAHLHLSASVGAKDAAGVKVEMSGSNSDFRYFMISGTVEAPFDDTLPAGKYRYTAWHYPSRQSQSAYIDLVAGKKSEKMLAFEKMHVGRLKLSVLMDGKIVPDKDFYKYASVKITSASTSKQVNPLPGGMGRYLTVLPSGTYDVQIHEKAWGNADIHLTGIKISDDETMERTITLQRPGELQLVSLWKTSKFNEAECAVIKPLVTAMVIPIYAYLYLTDTHLALGNSDNIAMCYPDINPMVVTYTRRDKKTNHSTAPNKVYSDEFPTMKTRVAAIRLVPGMYDFSLWPLKHKELQTTLKNIKIEADKAVLKELVFKRPDQ